MVALVALVFVGPEKLPGMMRATGEWVGKLRRLTSDMRAQTGIDDILREEGIDGVRELRTLLRGEHVVRSGVRSTVPQNSDEPDVLPELLDEFPVEGVDAMGVLPDDLLADSKGPETKEKEGDQAQLPSENAAASTLSTKPDPATLAVDTPPSAPNA